MSDLEEGPDSDTISRIDLNEFREFGYLQEVNRLFFHPLGLALEVVGEFAEDGEFTITHLGGIWDYRDDPEGMLFYSVDADKAARVAAEFRKKKEERRKRFGWDTQPAGEGEVEELFPCERCGKLRTKSEGGTVFTVCDSCWEEK